MSGVRAASRSLGSGVLVWMEVLQGVGLMKGFSTQRGRGFGLLWTASGSGAMTGSNTN